VINLVKIWGNWCGPDWTGGQRVSAQDYQGDWNSKCIDDLDCACRKHDKACSGPKGCSKKSDEALISVALRSAGNPITRIFNPSKADAADKIILALSVAKNFRKH
tara:strand:+ start:530 stop:844 length:315 start_codon:yes stop_codon:yes gene_type:complete